MADSTTAGWRELQRPLQAECPKTFYNLVIVESGLELQLTDLVAIWHCSLSRSHIIVSAKAQHTSIDPSQSSSQLQVLLQKLEQGLKSDRNQLYHDKDIESQVVYLKTRVDLPHPLKPLTWIFELAPQPATELAEHLLRPSLFESAVLKRKLESLQNVIKEKDHVLSRLFERIEATSTDLSMIFPGITGLKSRRERVTVREAEKHVPGMRKFDVQEWTSHFHTDNPYAGYDQRGIGNLVSGCEQCPKHAAKEHFNWLEKLPKYDSEAEKSHRQSKERTMVADTQPDLANDGESTASEDDFERQPTPPSLRKKSKTRTSRSRSVSSSGSPYKGRSTIPKGTLSQIGRLDHYTNVSRGASKQTTSSPPQAEHRTSQHRHGSASSTASETQSEPEPEPEPESISTPRKAAIQDNTSTPSPLPKSKASEFLRPTAPSSPSSSEDDDLDLDSQPTKPTPKPTSKPTTTKSSHPISNPPTPSPHKPSTPLHHSPHHQTPSSPIPLPLLVSTSPTTHPRNPPSNPSNPSTPSKPRRLGRLGLSQSQSQSQVQSQSHPSTTKTTLASTSPPSKPSHPPAPEDPTSFTTTTTDPDPETSTERDPSPSPSQQPKKGKEETVSEAANRRRTELKRKLEGTKTGRKKRKF